MKLFDYAQVTLGRFFTDVESLGNVIESLEALQFPLGDFTDREKTMLRRGAIEILYQFDALDGTKSTYALDEFLCTNMMDAFNHNEMSQALQEKIEKALGCGTLESGLSGQVRMYQRVIPVMDQLRSMEELYSMTTFRRSDFGDGQRQVAEIIIRCLLRVVWVSKILGESQ